MENTKTENSLVPVTNGFSSEVGGMKKVSRKRRRPVSAPRTRNSKPKVTSIFQQSLETSPFFPGINTIPYTKREYELLNDYQVSDQLPEKFLTNATHPLQSNKIITCNCVDSAENPRKLYAYKPFEERFETDLPCLKQRVCCRTSNIFKGRDLKLGVDLEETNVWGIDCYVSKNIQIVLSKFTPLQDKDLQEAFISRLLLPTANFLPDEVGFYIKYSLKILLRVLEKLTGEKHEAIASSKKKENEWSRICGICDFQKTYLKLENQLISLVLSFNHLFSSSNLSLQIITVCCLKLLSFVEKEGFERFRLHPKGLGVRCLRKEGIPNGRFVQHYLGELFPPWRWFEKQDAIKNAQKKVKFKPILPDFYNIMLEKHNNDLNGYDVVFIDPIVKGNYGSRLSHSCDANCATVALSVNGRYTIALYAIKDIIFGEELTFDYASVTEDINEFKAAICLCANCNQCKGSFLQYFGTSAFTAVLETEHTTLDRTAILLLSCSARALSQSDRDRFLRFSLKGAVLDHLPLWLLKWTSMTLHFAEIEHKHIQPVLLKLRHKQTNQLLYSQTSAEAEAKALLEKRRQHVVITLNKIKHYLMLYTKLYGSNDLKALETVIPPLVLLSRSAAVEYLWNDERAPLRQSLPSVCKALNNAYLMNKVAIALDSKVTYSNFKALLKEIREVVRTCIEAKLQLSVDLFMCFDLLTWIYHTNLWFTAENYTTVKSPMIKIRNVDIGRDGCVVDDSIKPTASILDDCTTEAPPAKVPRVNPLKIVYTEKKKYPGQFVWGQLKGWFKQTVASPWASLSAERRGSSLLPDFSCCLTSGKTVTCKPYKHRTAVMKRIGTDPTKQWPSKEKWGFKNALRVFGTPWLEESIRFEQLKDILSSYSVSALSVEKKYFQQITTKVIEDMSSIS